MNNTPLRSGLLTASALVLAVSAFTTARPASAQHRIVNPIDETRRVTLAGNTRSEATAENDLGQVDDTLPLEHMQLLLRRSDELQQKLDDYTESLADKGSPNYHHWLTPDEFGARFGADKQDIEAVSEWLVERGFQVNTVYPNRMTLDFSGSAAQVREAFGTEVHAYDVDGVRHIANNRDPQVPEALAPVVAGVVSLHDFRPRPMRKARTEYTFTESGNWFAMTPSDLATIYNLKKVFNAGVTGKGQTIVVVEDTNLHSSAD